MVPYFGGRLTFKIKHLETETDTSVGLITTDTKFTIQESTRFPDSELLEDVTSIDDIRASFEISATAYSPTTNQLQTKGDILVQHLGHEKRFETIFTTSEILSDKQVRERLNEVISQELERQKAKLRTVLSVKAEVEISLNDLATALTNDMKTRLGQGQKEQIAPVSSSPLRTDDFVRAKPIFLGRGFARESDLCFVLLPLKEPFTGIYNDHIKPTLEKECGLRCRKADDIFSNTPIIEDIWAEVNKSSLIIAELTGRNPNVYYEVGMCHTLGKDVVMITQSLDDVPFDLKHLRVIEYANDYRGCGELRDKLKATATNLLQKTRSI